MSQFFISCKESKIENNRSFYGCFQLGPFEPSQSITIANALRRTLLSELYGLSIISVEIEGATHEYSNIKGVKDSVLDILLNMKEIVLKKTINTIGIKPQIGYLKARGPGIIRASNLNLPPFIQCVDPDQYIATLSNDGFLNMKFIIQYSNKWISNQHLKGLSSSRSNDRLSKGLAPFQNQDFLAKEETSNLTSSHTGQKPVPNIYDYNNIFNLHLKKRRLILKKLKQIGLKSSNLYINLFSKFIHKQSKKVTIQSLYPNIYIPASTIHKIRKYNQSDCRKPVRVSLGLNNMIEHDSDNTTRDISVSNFEKRSPWVSYLQVPSLKLLKVKKNEHFRYDQQGGCLVENSKVVEIQKKRKLFLTISNFMKKCSKKYPAINLKKKTKKVILNSQNKIIGTVNQLASVKLSGSSRNDKINHNIHQGIGKDHLITNSSIFFNSNPLTIDAIFNPVTKVNYLIEVNDFKMTQTSFETSIETLELFEILNIPKTETQLIDLNRENNIGSLNGLITPQNLSLYNKNPKILENILSIKRDINSLKNEIPKHNIIFEIWTNGSIHPRDAIYQAFKNLFKIFSKLNKLNTFMVNPLIVNSLQGNISKNTIKDKEIKKNYYFKKIKQNEVSSTFTESPQLMTTTMASNLLPLNETTFLSTYMSPKLKNYYLGVNNLKSLPKKQPVSNITQFNNLETTILSGNEHKKNITIKTLEVPSSIIISDNEAAGSQPIMQAVTKNLDYLNINILNLSLRSYTYLKRLNINTIADVKSFLNSYSLKPLSEQYMKLSKTCLEEIKQSLEKIELKNS